jgi:hypothetical protein
MQYSPMLVSHICSGTVGCLSGFVAAFLRKGSRRHGLAGNVFVCAPVERMNPAQAGVPVPHNSRVR